MAINEKKRFVHISFVPVEEVETRVKIHVLRYVFTILNFSSFLLFFTRVKIHVLKYVFTILNFYSSHFRQNIVLVMVLEVSSSFGRISQIFGGTSKHSVEESNITNMYKERRYLFYLRDFVLCSFQERIKHYNYMKWRNQYIVLCFHWRSKTLYI